MAHLQSFFHYLLRRPQYYWAGLIGILLSTLPVALPGLTLDNPLPLLMASYSCQNCSRPQGPVTSGGIRGSCSANNSAPLTPLAPEVHIGRTTSSHPTFAWYIPDTEPFPIEFNLYALEANGEFRLVHSAPLTSNFRLMSHTLPASEPALQTGQRYLWQVLLICDPNLPSSAIDIEAFVDVVAPESATVDETMGATQLAEQGFWYDAMTEAIAEPSDTAWLTLLDDLAQVELEAGESPPSSRYNHLQLILQHEENPLPE